MTATEKIELLLIPVMGIGFWFIAFILPDMISVGRLLLAASSFLLFQSLLRDLYLLLKKRDDQADLKRTAQCMCIESTVGITGIVIGCILLGVGVGQLILMNEWKWSVMAMLVLSCGFLMKDYILEWDPWQIRQEKDHMNIVFTWKK